MAAVTAPKPHLATRRVSSLLREERKVYDGAVVVTCVEIAYPHCATHEIPTSTRAPLLVAPVIADSTGWSI